MITILLRTSYRPIGFARAIASIPAHCNIIVSYDDVRALNYIPENLTKIHILPIRDKPYWFDEYCNILKNTVTEGYFMFLDDDDYLITLPDESQLREDAANIVQLNRRGTIRPQSADFKAGQIGMPCLILHSKHKHLADIPGTGQGDYFWIKAVTQVLPVNFLEIVCVGSDSRGFGRQEPQT